MKTQHSQKHFFYMKPFLFFPISIKHKSLPYLNKKESESQTYPTLCYPLNYVVHGILQTRILEWVAFPSSRASSPPGDQTQVSHIAVPLKKNKLAKHFFMLTFTWFSPYMKSLLLSSSFYRQEPAAPSVLSSPRPHSM